MSDLPDSFYRAEAAWRNPPENSPEYDEWADAQEEKKDLLKKADDIIESLPAAGLSSYDELDEAIGIISGVLDRLKPVLDELGYLIDSFPDKEPDPDAGWDDPDIGGR